MKTRTGKVYLRKRPSPLMKTDNGKKNKMGQADDKRQDAILTTYDGILTRRRYKLILDPNAESQEKKKMAEKKRKTAARKRKASQIKDDGMVDKDAPLNKKRKLEEGEPQPSCSFTCSEGEGSSASCSDEHFDSEHLENLVNTLLCSFPDCEPDYIREKLVTIEGSESKRLETARNELEQEWIKYPKIKDVLKRQYAEELATLPFGIEEFVYRFPKLEEHFTLKDKAGSPTYRQQKRETMAVYFINKFRYLTPLYVRRMIVRRLGLPLCAPNRHKIGYQKLQEANDWRKENPRAMGIRNRYHKSPRMETHEYPKTAQEEFFWELFYIQNETEIKEYLEKLATEKNLAYTKAVSENELVECPICVNQVLKEELLKCSAGEGLEKNDTSGQHAFCKDCLVNSAKESIGQGRALVPCLYPTCKQYLPPHTLRQHLSYELLALVTRRALEEELATADIEGLVTCPQCTYSVILPEGSIQKILQCENPLCLATTCRLCKKPSHGFFECGKQEAVKLELQKQLEMAVTEAIVRQCPQCTTQIIKEAGCNHMKCPKCETPWCYICREKIETGYAHFAGNAKCGKVTDVAILHEREAKEAFGKTSKAFRADNPILKGQKLEVAHLKPWTRYNNIHD